MPTSEKKKKNTGGPHHCCSPELSRWLSIGRALRHCYSDRSRSTQESQKKVLLKRARGPHPHPQKLQNRVCWAGTWQQCCCGHVRSRPRSARAEPQQALRHKSSSLCPVTSRRLPKYQEMAKGEKKKKNKRGWAPQIYGMSCWSFFHWFLYFYIFLFFFVVVVDRSITFQVSKGGQRGAKREINGVLGTWLHTLPLAMPMPPHLSLPSYIKSRYIYIYPCTIYL